jgi:hypothetical protein
MSDSTILYAGIFCFGLILLGFALTINEFRAMRRRAAGKSDAGRRGASRGAVVESDAR